MAAPAAPPDVATLVDVERYPLRDLDGRGAAVVATHAAAFAERGLAMLDGFLRPDAVAAMAAEADALAPGCHHQDVLGTPYLRAPDDGFADGHPARHLGRSALTAVPYDVLPATSALRALYEDDAVLDFTALATPSAGHAPFLGVLQPGLPVQPPTLFVNKAAIADDRHGELTWGAAQAGVAAGVADAVADGLLDGDVVDLVVIAAVWVNPAATDADAVAANNRAATRGAIAAGASGAPDVAAVVVARHDAWNPYFRAR